jgi:inosose dehydratase
MKVAYTGWTWLINHQDNYKWEFEQFLKEVAEIGYDSVENFAFITKYFDNDAAEVAGLLKKYGLHMANLYEHYTNDSEADYNSAVAYVDFMKKIGSDHLNLQGAMWREDPQDRPLDKERVKEYAEVSNKIGKLCTENGIKACMHPHANTPIFTEADIDYFAENTDPKYVHLCIDTAHTVLAGIDPVKAFQKYVSRIGYVHLKDVSSVEAVPGQRMSRFTALGMGTVDFLGVYNALKDGGYDGVLCVELDRPYICNYKSALISRQYIKNVLGI